MHINFTSLLQKRVVFPSLFIYLAPTGLSCGMWVLFLFFFLSCVMWDLVP